MQRVLLSSLVFFCAASLAVAQLPTVDSPRNWKTTEGAAFQASLVSYDGTTAIFKMPNGSHTQAPATKLSTEDQEYLAQWQKKQPIKVTLPEHVGVETSQVKAEVVSEDAAAEKFVYRTEHFEFESQGKFNQVLLREVSRNFEATYELLKALPWYIEPTAEEGNYFHARLLKNKDAYHAAGGMINSGGVYKGGQKVFLVPFESIGVKLVGKAYAQDKDFETHTMVHELTHQMMHSSLGLLPQWVVEGTAEYTGTLPLHTGQFRLSAAKNGLRDYLAFLKTRVSGVPEPYPLEQLFPITNEQWNQILESDPRMSHRLYFTSFLLVYYFMHLNGKGDGQLLARYFREVAETRKAVEEFRLHPGATKRPEVLASAQARTDFQKKTLYILLDGRSEADLMKQIRTGYAHLGIRL